MDSSAHKHPPAFAVTVHNYDYPSKTFSADDQDRAVIVVDPPRERATDSWAKSSDDIDFYTALVEPMSGNVSKRKNRRSLQLLMQTLLPHPSDGQRSRAQGDDNGYVSTSSAESSSVLSPTDSYFSSPGPSTTTTSPRDSPPLDFLLDDDPFANLSVPPPRRKSLKVSAAPSPPLRPAPAPPVKELKPIAPPPRSPLMPLDDEIPKKSLPRANSTECTSPTGVAFAGAIPARPGRERAISGARNPLPAYQRPAFTARPSLPSLSTLAKMNVVLTKKVRKGRVGAGLPFEPWATLESSEEGEHPSPTRVLQDVNGQNTESLPVGTQPLLPSQLVRMSSTSSVSHQSTVSSPALPVSTLLTFTSAASTVPHPTSGQSILVNQGQSHSRPQLSISTSSSSNSPVPVEDPILPDDGDSREVSPTGSSEGGDLVDSYYSELLDDNDREYDETLDDNLPQGFAGQEVAGTPVLISADDPLFSPLSSSGISTLDLELSPTTAIFPLTDPKSPASPIKHSRPPSPHAALSTTSPTSSPTGPYLISTLTTGSRGLELATSTDTVSFTEELPPPKAYHSEESAWYKGSPVSSPSKTSRALSSPARSASSNVSSGFSSPTKEAFLSFARLGSHALSGESEESYSSGKSFTSGGGLRRPTVSSVATRSSSEDSGESSSSDPLASPPESMIGDAVHGWLPQPNYYPFNFKSVSYFPPYPTSASSPSVRKNGSGENGSPPASLGGESSTDRVASWRRTSATQSTGFLPGGGPGVATSYLSDLDLSDADMDGEPPSFSSSFEGSGKAFGLYGYAGRELEGSCPSSADTIRPSRNVDDTQTSRLRRSMLFSGVMSGSEEDWMDSESSGRQGLYQKPQGSHGYDGVHAGGRDDLYDSSLSSGSSESCSQNGSSWQEDDGASAEGGDEQFFDALDSPPVRDSISSTLGVEDGVGGQQEIVTEPLFQQDGDDRRNRLGECGGVDVMNANPPALLRSTSSDGATVMIPRDQRSLNPNHYHIDTTTEQDMRLKADDFYRSGKGMNGNGASEMVDGSGKEGGSGGGDYRAWAASSREQGGSASHSSRSHGGRGRGVGGNGGEDEDDGRDDRRRRVYQHVPEAHSSTATSEDEGQPKSSSGATRFPSSTTPLLHSSAGSSDDDDIPLAQRIPTALKAQKSIRKQVREERLQRRATKNRSQAMGESTDSDAIRERERHATLRPSGAGGPLLPPASSAMSSSVEAALLAASGGNSIAPEHHSRGTSTVTRPRGLTLPGQPIPPPVTNEPFSAEDLSRRLQSVRVSSDHPRHQPLASSGASRGPPPPYEQYPTSQTVTRARPSLDDRPPVSAAPSSANPDLQRKKTMKDVGPNPTSPATSTTRGLRPMRSFHQAERRVVTDTFDAPATTTLQRHTTTVRAPPATQTRSRGESVSAAQAPITRYRSLSVSRGGNSSTHGHPTSGYDEFGAPLPPVPPLPGMNHTSQAPSSSHRMARPNTTSGRPSMDNDRTLASRPSTSNRSAAPPLPSAVEKAVVVQQRVFIGDMQKFNIVEITNTTSAGDVVELLDEQGALKGIIGTGGWMVWEVAQDFGMERPIRSFEILFDIQSSWNKDKSTNMFVLKLTPLSALLNPSAIPSSAPIYSGYVEWESKRGKWSKRWMELREHCLWLSKREGKDEVMLCSLSSFDAYTLTRAYRSTKHFTFAVKSTDNLSYFEDTADYLHMFSCTEKDGRAWIERILVARSYVLQQERQILFNPKVPGGNTGSSTLARATTTRRSAPSRPAQPLITIPAPITAQPSNGLVFEPGSLLHKHP